MTEGNFKEEGSMVGRWRSEIDILMLYPGRDRKYQNHPYIVYMHEDIKVKSTQQSQDSQLRNAPIDPKTRSVCSDGTDQSSSLPGSLNPQVLSLG